MSNWFPSCLQQWYIFFVQYLYYLYLFLSSYKHESFFPVSLAPSNTLPYALSLDTQTLNVSRTSCAGYSHPQHVYAHSHSKARRWDLPFWALAGNPWILGISPRASWVPRHAVWPSAVFRHRTVRGKRTCPGTRGKVQRDRKDGKWLHRSSRYLGRMMGWARYRQSKTNGFR